MKYTQSLKEIAYPVIYQHLSGSYKNRQTQVDWKSANHERLSDVHKGDNSKPSTYRSVSLPSNCCSPSSGYRYNGFGRLTTGSVVSYWVERKKYWLKLISQSHASHLECPICLPTRASSRAIVCGRLHACCTGPAITTEADKITTSIWPCQPPALGTRLVNCCILIRIGGISVTTNV